MNKMKHQTKEKGDIGLTKIIADLTEKGFGVSLPISEHLQYDFIVDLHGSLKRVQIKYRSLKSNTSISFSCKTSHVGLNGKAVERYYTKDDFELYAIYSPSTKHCYYIPNIGQSTITIAEHQIQSHTPFYWWEDFLDPLRMKLPEKRKGKDFEGFSPIMHNIKHGIMKVPNRPKFNDLIQEINKLGYVGVGRKYGVSDNAVRKWEKKDKKELLNNKL